MTAFLAKNWGNFASGAGLLLTIWTLLAARAAKRAVEIVQQRLDSFNSAADLASALEILKDVQAHNHSSSWQLLEERYGTLKRLLSQIKGSNAGTLLSEEEKIALGSVERNLASLQDDVERALGSNARPPNVRRMNEIITAQMVKLTEILVRLRHTADPVNGDGLLRFGPSEIS